MMSAYTLPTARTNSGSRGKNTQRGREGSPGHARCISLLATILGATNAAARVKIEIEVLEEIH